MFLFPVRQHPPDGDIEEQEKEEGGDFRKCHSKIVEQIRFVFGQIDHVLTGQGIRKPKTQAAASISSASDTTAIFSNALRWRMPTVASSHIAPGVKPEKSAASRYNTLTFPCFPILR